MRILIFSLSCVLFFSSKIFVQAQPPLSVCTNCNVGGATGNFVSQPYKVTAYLYPDGTAILGNVVYYRRGSPPPPSNQAYPNQGSYAFPPNHQGQGIGGPYCSCIGGVCNNCNVG